MDEYFLIQNLYFALRDLLEHEGEKTINGIGIECDSEALEYAKKIAQECLEQGRKYLNL